MTHTYTSISDENEILREALASATCSFGPSTVPKSARPQKVDEAYQTPGAGYDLLGLHIQFVGEKSCRHSSHRLELKDGYDGYRELLDIGRLLDDPNDDIAACYDFTANGTATFVGHFKADKPVNNKQGYQALFFDNKGDVTAFAACDAKGKAHRYEKDDPIPQIFSEAAAVALAAQPVTRLDILSKIIEQKIFKNEMGYELTRYHAKENQPLALTA